MTPANVNVNTFGKKFTLPVDGYVYAQPLVATQQNIAGGLHNVVYVATAHDSVYAFDADGTTTTPYWKTSFIDPVNGIIPVPGADVTVGDEWGVIGTPVIDRSRNAIFVVSRVKNTKDGTYHQHFHALDLSTGAEKSGSPVEISACVSGTGNASSKGQVCFDPLYENNRVSLALVNNVVYAGWASLNDYGPYHGWVIGFDADTLHLVVAFNSTPNGDDGGYWMSGAAPGVESDGSLLLVSGNGDFDPGDGDYGESVVHLSKSGAQLNVIDYFTPSNWAALEPPDLDFGSGGLLMLPDNNSGHPHELLVAGKEGRLFLLDRDNLGKFHSGSNQVVQEIAGAFPGGLFATGAYWNGNVYFVGNADVIRQFSWSNGLISTTPAAVGGAKYSFPGATPAVSSNGSTNGIVWTVERTDATSNKAVLHAYDATNVSKELYNSTQNSTRDNAGLAVKFVVPTVTNGKVYVGTIYNVVVYGLQ
ncbi:MAG TPA: hypothetical protein VMU24_03075 [Candidatus Acidoferrales bacterium]|nr:hypothetical protein [Candidatus Acidoferrales bacterium]